MTAKEILEILKSISYPAFAYEDYNSNELGLGNVTEIDGGMSKGDTWYSVKHFTDHDVYIRIDGWYQSYNGAEFDNPPYEVKPQLKIITTYVSVNDEIEL